MKAIKGRWPDALVQFEDFAAPLCLDLLKKFKNTYLCFNDDLQG